MGDEITHENMAEINDSESEQKSSTSRDISKTSEKNFYLQLDLRNYEKAAEILREGQLVEAVIGGNFPIVRDLLKSGVSVDAEELNRAFFYASRDYMTPLQFAATLGNDDCVNILIQYHANVNARNRYDVTALHMAAESGHFLCLKALLDAGADYNAATKYSRRGGYYTAIPYLGGTTPLHLATANNHIDCVSELIQYGADYNAVDENGRTGLYIAAQAGYSECVLAQIRLAVGYDILSLPGFETGDTPLHFAVRRGMIDCVKELLLLGSDVSHVNYSGFSPLHYAVSNDTRDLEKSFEILKLIVLHGYNCDVNLQDSHEVTPLHYVTFGAGSVFRKRPDMAAFLIAHGADINIRNHRGVSLLEYEYNSSTDASVLYAIVQSMNMPTHFTNLRDFHQNASFTGLMGNIAPFYAMWLALGRGNDPDADLELQRLPLNPLVEMKRKWYHSVVTNPRPLMHSCRYVIRKAMGPKRLRRIRELPLPEYFLSYLLFKTEAFPC